MQMPPVFVSVISADEFVTVTAGDNDFTGIFKTADYANNLLLRFLNVLDTDRSHVFHIFLEHGSLAL